MRFDVKNFFLFLFFPIAAFCSIGVFTPPENWDCADPKILSSHVRIGFLGKEKNSLRPSINLASETISASKDDYLLAVKKLHTSTPNTTFRDLGPFSTQAGEAHLFDVITKTAYGQLHMLQMIFIKNDEAFVLTGAATVDSFLSEYPHFIKAFKSFTLTDNLLSLIPDAEKKASLLSLYDDLKKQIPAKTAKKTWEKFQNFVLNDYKELGSYWQILYLKQVQEENLEYFSSIR
jgi:hypothetical protein